MSAMNTSYETKNERSYLLIKTLVYQKVGIQEKTGITYPKKATNLQPAELRWWQG